MILSTEVAKDFEKSKIGFDFYLGIFLHDLKLMDLFPRKKRSTLRV